MPSTITTWQAGKLYQPGDVVIPNEGGDVTQVFPTNADFESGDTGWTKENNWTIDQNDAFQGTWSAAYAGEFGGLLGIFSSDGDGAGSQTTYTTTNGTAFVTDFEPFRGRRQTSSASRIIAVNNISGDQRAYWSLNGTDWNLASTIPWDVFDNGVTAVDWDPNTGLFFAFGTPLYWTSPDGDVWTERNTPGGAGAFHKTYVVGATTYAITFSGRVYSTTDGINWSIVTVAIGQTVQDSVQVGSNIYVIRSSTGNVQMSVASTGDLSSWTRLTTGETSIESQLNSAVLNNGVQMAASGGVFVVQCVFNSKTSVTDHLATATDPDGTWTAQSTESGNQLSYSPTLGQFITTSGGLSGSPAFLGKSTDGSSWVYTQYDSSNGLAAGVWDLSADDPIYYIINDLAATVIPGQTVRVRAQAKTNVDSACFVGLRWYDDLSVEISTEFDSTPVQGASTGWRETYFIGVAPPNAAFCAVVVGAQGGPVRVDNIVWEYFSQAGFCDFTFEATQATAAYSGTAEPVWPTVLGNTVVDNAVTWTARLANCITYEAKPILKSGPTEPSSWPTEIDAGVADNTILWRGEDQRIDDENCPNSKYVAIAASKIFSADVDVVAFSATINPLDWTSENDAGFIPFGLNTYGANDITALGLYRSNLVVFNTAAFQMWQVDEDPTNIAILDAVPVGCPHYKSLSPVSNDLVFLTEAGIRSMGIAGASTNLQAGSFGKQVDPLVLAALSGTVDLDDIISLYYPGQGQYWLIFGAEAFVLTMNGGKKDMSWSRYVFPSDIDDWTLDGADLILRSGDKVWRLDEDTLIDDSGGANVAFVGEVWWPYLDFGALGQNKTMIGFDTVATGEYKVVFGYNQNDDSQVTADYTITNGDTLVGDIIPMPITAPSFQMRLTFTGNTAWEWSASSLYVQDLRRTS